MKTLSTQENLAVLAHVDIVKTLSCRLEERNAHCDSIEDVDERLAYALVGQVIAEVLAKTMADLREMAGIDEDVPLAEVIELFDGNRRLSRGPQ